MENPLTLPNITCLRTDESKVREHVKPPAYKWTEIDQSIYWKCCNFLQSLVYLARKLFISDNTQYDLWHTWNLADRTLFIWKIMWFDIWTNKFIHISPVHVEPPIAPFQSNQRVETKLWVVVMATISRPWAWEDSVSTLYGYNDIKSMV